MTADQILQKHEDANEMHFHQVDREFIIQAMEEYATSSKTEISDEEIEKMLFHHSNEYAIGFKDAIKWYREQLNQNNNLKLK